MSFNEKCSFQQKCRNAFCLAVLTFIIFCLYIHLFFPKAWPWNDSDDDDSKHFTKLWFLFFFSVALGCNPVACDSSSATSHLDVSSPLWRHSWMLIVHPNQWIHFIHLCFCTLGSEKLCSSRVVLTLKSKLCATQIWFMGGWHDMIGWNWFAHII